MEYKDFKFTIFIYNIQSFQFSDFYKLLGQHLNIHGLTKIRKESLGP